MKKKHEQTSMISIIKKINKILPSKIDSSIFTIIHIRFSQNKPSYKSKHEHLKPDNVLTQRPCLPQRMFAKQKSSTILEVNRFISFGSD